MKIISLTYKEAPYYLTTWGQRSGHPSGYTLHDFRFKFENEQKTYTVKTMTIIDSVRYAILTNDSKIKISQSEFDLMKDNGIKTL